MQGVRIEPRENGNLLLVDIGCDCGRNALKDEKGKASALHPIRVSSHETKTLTCLCGKKYSIAAATSHIHIKNL